MRDFARPGQWCLCCPRKPAIPSSDHEHFQIGLHHSLDSEPLRDAVELVEVESLAAPRFRERLEAHVQADGVSEAEAVRDGAGDTIDFQALALDAMLLDPNSRSCGHGSKSRTRLRDGR